MSALTFQKFSEISVDRADKWHGPGGIDMWSLSDWMVAACGELGEAANVVKKLNRLRDGVRGNREDEATLRLQLGEECADAVTYIILFCAKADIDLEYHIVGKFNKVSEEQGFPHRL